jgi:hypothetical protein
MEQEEPNENALKLAINSICCLAIISVACSLPFFQSNEEEIVIPTLLPRSLPFWSQQRLKISGGCQCTPPHPPQLS